MIRLLAILSLGALIACEPGPRPQSGYPGASSTEASTGVRVSGYVRYGVSWGR